LELNPNNDLVKVMKQEFQNDIKSVKLQEMMSYAYDQAILLE